MINQITKIRLRDGREVALVDWTDRPLWSTIEILDGATIQEMNFFQYTVGDAVPAFASVAVAAQRTAVDTDTDMATPGSMASTEEFLTFAIKPEMFQLRVADENAPNFQAPSALQSNGEPLPPAPLLGVLNLRTTLSLEISQKVYSEAGFGYYNFGGGVSVGGNGDTATRAFGNNGIPSQEAVRSFVIPQHIGGQEKFRVFLENAAGVALEIGLGDGGNVDEDPRRFVRIRVYLDGLYKRPVS
jgi:hypothetical protein